MPAKAAGKKGKKEEPKPITGNYDNITVRECLVWDAGKKRKGGKSANKENEDGEARKAHFRPVKGQLGKPVDRGYSMPEETHQPPEDDSGTVAEAVQGWPRNRREREEREAEEFRLQQEAQQAACNKSGKKSKKKSKEEEKEEEKGDPWMGDLIAHRFQADFVKQREAEEEEERRKQEAKNKAASTPAWKKKTDIKANKTSQLRAIAAAQKVDINPKDLWQMSKFKNNAAPHLTTFRNGKRADGNEKERSGMINGDGEVAAVCTCQDETLDNHDGRAYYQRDMEDEYEHHPAYDTARDAEF